MWLLTLIIIAAVSYLFYLYRVRNKNYWRDRGVPTASGFHWFFGNYKKVLTNEEDAGILFEKLYNEFPDSPVVGYLNQDTPELLVKDPALIKAVLVTDFSSFHKNAILILDPEKDFLFAYNPFLLYGEPWKLTRSHATQGLTYAKLKGYLPSMLSVADTMTEYIKGQCNEKGLAQLDLKDITKRYTIDVYGNAICGVKNNTFENENSLFATFAKEVFKMNFMNGLKIVLTTLFPILVPIVKPCITTNKTQDFFMNLIRNIIDDRASRGEIRNDVLQVMLNFKENDNKGVFTDKYIASQMFLVFLDLYETSSSVLTSILYDLAWHSDVQDKLRQELYELKSKIKGEYMIDDIENFKYLDMVVSESLRMLNPLPALLVECTSDYKMTVPGREEPLYIRKGTEIAISLTGIHKDPKYYPEPEKYSPEHFSDDAIANRPKYTFMPFGDGPRKCVGQRIALLQIKAAVMKIIERYRLKPSARNNYPLEFVPAELPLFREFISGYIYFEEIKIQ